MASTDLSKAAVYERLALYFVGSIGSFFALDALLPLSVAMVDGALRVGGHQHLLLVRQRHVGRLVENRYRDRHPVGALADKVRRLGLGLVLAGSDPGGGAAVRAGVRPRPPADPAERQGFQGAAGGKEQRKEKGSRVERESR